LRLEGEDSDFLVSVFVLSSSPLLGKLPGKILKLLWLTLIALLIAAEIFLDLSI